MRALACAMVAFVVGCGGGGNTQVSTSSAPPGGGGSGGTTPGGGGSGTPGGGGMPGGGGGMPGGGGGGTGGGGSGGGGSGGTGGGGAGGGGGGGAACTLTAPVTVAAGLKSVGLIKADDRDVYYIDQGPTSLWRVAKSGDTPEVVDPYLGTLNDDVYAWDYAVDATTIYIMNYGRGGMTISPGGVSFVDKTTLATRRYVSATEPPGDCHTPTLLRIVVDHGDVYWIQDNGFRYAVGSTCSAVPSQIVRLPAGSTTPAPVAALTMPTSAGMSFVTDGSHLFWSTDAGVWRMVPGGGAQEPLLHSSQVNAIAPGGDSLFVARSPAVYRLPAPEVLDPILDQAANRLVFDGAHVYVTTGNGVYRVAPDGSGATQLGSGSASGVAVDDQYVYYGQGGSIMKACK